MRLPLLCLAIVCLLCPLRRASGAEPFFKKGDVIALVGGEDMVVASETGYLELLLTRALPDYYLRFRNLAWEGDTVFEQRRDLNFPTWEEQLDKIGATVVICQFGQMESLGNEGRMNPGGTTAEEAKAELPKFIAAYEKLIERFSAGGKRRVVIVEPTPIQKSDARATTIRGVGEYWSSIHTPPGGRRIDLMSMDGTHWSFKKDGVHLDEFGHKMFAMRLAFYLTGHPDHDQGKEREPLRQLIVAKNKLWFDYWRPQNWAFLAGDRTNQPSSRDWRDPSIRWFPPEREEFLPLIEAKEKEIDALAQKLAAGK